MRHPFRPLSRGLAATVVLASAILVAGTYAVTAEEGGDRRAIGALDEGVGLIGSWELVSFSVRTEDGRVSHPLGEDAEGRLICTPDGRTTVAIWRTDRAPFAASDQQRGTAEEYTAAVQSYIQYLGTFTVDPAAGTVSVQVDQSVYPNWNGTTQLRYYQLEGNNDRLRISSVPFAYEGTTIVASAVFRRA